MKSTNYHRTLIEVAEDCPVNAGTIPTDSRNKKTIASLQFDLIYSSPFKYNSDQVLFTVYAFRKGLNDDEMEDERIRFLSKGQPCFRSSPLPKIYGWGVYSNSEGKIALFGKESAAYQNLLLDDSVHKTKAMRKKKA